MSRRAAKDEAPLDLSDLLGRAAVNLDTPELQRFLAGKRVMVTGAGGSIGSEICRQTMKFCPDRLLMIERAENALFEIDRELRQTWVGAELCPYVADITDATRIDQIFAAERPHVIFHAAAHKHVPMMEINPGEAIKNNVFGTQTVAAAAAEHGAAAFVLISTDKAINPSSVMGAAKRVAEMIVSNFGATSAFAGVVNSADHGTPKPLRKVEGHRTRFMSVRFGNVLGSSGSVVPIFQRQIAAGGPVTVTHAEMTRYFMTVPEASQLVMQAGAIGKGGEVFVLDMGEPMKIDWLARDLIRRSGKRVGVDIELRYTGIRPGEKLFEELAKDDDRTLPTSHAKIRAWQLPTVSAGELAGHLDRLATAVDGGREAAVTALRAAVPEYAPGESVAESAPLRLTMDSAPIAEAAA